MEAFSYDSKKEVESHTFSVTQLNHFPIFNPIKPITQIRLVRCNRSECHSQQLMLSEFRSFHFLVCRVCAVFSHLQSPLPLFILFTELIKWSMHLSFHSLHQVERENRFACSSFSGFKHRLAARINYGAEKGDGRRKRSRGQQKENARKSLPLFIFTGS